MNTRDKIFSIDEFIEYVELRRDKFIRYLEVIVTPSGDVMLAHPSHSERMFNYVMTKENMTRDELCESIPEFCDVLNYLVDKYGCISVWFDFMITPESISDEQSKSIKIFQEKGLLNNTPHVAVTHEYSLYLERKALGLE